MYKKLLIIFSLMPTTVLFATNNQTILHGTDLVPTDVGAVYTYEVPKFKGDDGSKYDILVKKCSEDKKQCTYRLRNYKANGELNGYTEFTYTFKDGAVYSTGLEKVDNGDGNVVTYESKNSDALFPDNIELNKTTITTFNYDTSSVTTVSKYTKFYPDYKINDKDYKDCVQQEITAKVSYKDNPSQNTESNALDVMCKGVGIVYKTQNMFDSKGNYVKLSDNVIYKDIVFSLKSVSHDNFDSKTKSQS